MLNQFSKSTRKLFNNFASIGIIQICNYIFPLITIPFVSRIIGPDKYGVINFANAFIAYFTLLISYGFDFTGTRKVSRDPDNKENRNLVFSEILYSQILLFFISVCLFIILITYVPRLGLNKEVFVFTFLMCIGNVFTQNWLFQAMQDLPKVAVMNVVSKCIFTILIFATIHQKSDYMWQPLALSISQIILGVVSFIWAYRKYELRLVAVRLWDVFRNIWKEKTIFFSLCVINLYTSTTIVILSFFQSNTEIGYYSSAQKIITILQSLIAIPLGQAFFPFIGKAFGESHEKGIRIAQTIFPLIFMLTFILGILIMIGAPLIISTIFGANYMPAVLLCRSMAFIPMLISLNIVAGIHVMLNLKMDKSFLRITFLSAAISVSANFLLVKVLGAMGSAFSWNLAEVLNLLLIIYVLKRKDIIIINKKYFRPLYYRQNFHSLKMKLK